MERTKQSNISISNKVAETLVVEAFRSDGYLMINKTLIKHLGLIPAVLISNYIDKHNYFKKKNPETYDGYFFLPYQQQIEQLHVSKETIRKYKSYLIKLGYISTKRYGLPAREWYHIEFINIINSLDTMIPEVRKTLGLEVRKTVGLGVRKTVLLYKENLYKDILRSSRNNEEDILKQSNKFPNTPITLSLFAEFWELYPRKSSKGQALTAWKNLCTTQTKKKDRPTWQQVMIAIKKQKKSERWQDVKFIPMASTWLNQYRWLDDPKEMISFTRENNELTCPYNFTFGKDFNRFAGCETCADADFKVYSKCKMKRISLEQ